MDAVYIGVIVGIIVGALQIITFFATRNKELKKVGEKDGEINQKLIQLKESADQNKAELKVLSDDVRNCIIGLSEVKACVSAYHKRLDGERITLPSYEKQNKNKNSK